MHRYLIKTVWLSSAAALIFIFFCAPSWSEPASRSRSSKSRTQQSYRFMTRVQYGTFLSKPLTDLATSRLWLDGEQRIKGPLGISALFSGRLRIEGAYGQNEDAFVAEAAQTQSVELTPRESYLQFAYKGLSLRLGYQSVVWGETFGFFYADVVNPKDLREGTLSGLADLADLRSPSPLANLQWLGENVSLQAIYVVGPSMNTFPVVGTPYFPIELDPTINFVVKDRSSESRPDHDWGGRMSLNFGNLDTSVFYFEHRDRMPYVEERVLSASPPTVELGLKQKNVSVVGVTATFQSGDHLIRLEEVSYSARRFNTLSGSTLAQADYDNHIMAIGWDLPEFNKWTFGVQYSADAIASRHSVLNRRTLEQLGMVRIFRETASGQSLELVHSVSLMDGSSQSSLQYSFPRSSNLEFLFGIESLQGGSKSQFGRMQGGSRILFGLRGVFDG